MGMIYKSELPKFKVGFPTISDKYNVMGGVLTGATAVNFGEVVKRSSTDGYYESAAAGCTLDNFAGFVIGTNVKLALAYPGTDASVKVMPGEAFNLLLDGGIAIALDSGATMTNVTNGAKAYIILATGKITTSDKASAGTIVELPGYVFTGEKDATNKIAEILVK